MIITHLILIYSTHAPRHHCASDDSALWILTWHLWQPFKPWIQMLLCQPEKNNNKRDEWWGFAGGFEEVCTFLYCCAG